MLNHQLLAFSPEGRIITTTDAPTNFNGGTPTTDTGQLCVELIALPDYFLGGLAYKTDGSLCASDAGGAIDHYAPGGMPMNAVGQLLLSSLGGPIAWNGGIPTNAADRVCAVSGTPINSPFSNGFSNGFGFGP
jgi:hypothetical protein